MPYERRQGNLVAIVALVVTLLTNIIALTWGASKMSSAINNLENTTSDLGRAVKEIQSFNSIMSTRMGIIEDRVLRNSTKIDEIGK